jgi:hypothetical protein
VVVRGEEGRVSMVTMAGMAMAWPCLALLLEMLCKKEVEGTRGHVGTKCEGFRVRQTLFQIVLV